MKLNHQTSTKRLRATIERRRKVRHWGVDYWITPRLIDKVFGDGKTLAYVMPLNTRPNYYVIRIDGEFNDDNMDDDEFRDLLAHEILDAIAEQYGDCDDDCELEAMADKLPWPALDSDCGEYWGELEWPIERKRGVRK